MAEILESERLLLRAGMAREKRSGVSGVPDRGFMNPSHCMRVLLGVNVNDSTSAQPCSVICFPYIMSTINRSRLSKERFDAK